MAKIKLLFDRSTGLKVTETAPGEYTITQETVVGTPGSPSVVSAEPFTLMAGKPKPHTHDYADIANPPAAAAGSDPLALTGRILPHTHLSADLVDRRIITLGPDTPPANPTIYDDEFTETALNSKWTYAVNTAASIRYATTPSWLQTRFTGNQSIYMREPYVPGAGNAFSVTAKFSHTGFNAGNYALVGLSAYADANNYLFFLIQWNGTTKASNINRTVGGVLTTNVQTRNMPASGHDQGYIHFQRDAGTNYRLWTSTDGVGWFPNSTTEAAVVFAPDITEIGVNINQSGQTAYCYAGIDWVRVNWLTL